MKLHREAIIIIESLGGVGNIRRYWHCAGRLRFQIKNENRVRSEEIAELDIVKGNFFHYGQYQIIVGDNVELLNDAIMDYMVGRDPDMAKIQGPDFLDVVFELLSSIFQPIMPGIAASGLLKAALSLLLWMGVMSPTSSTYLLWHSLSNAVFYFLPIFIAISAARRFEVSVSISVILAAALLYPDLAGLGKSGQDVSFMGLSIDFHDYSSSILPIIVTVYFQKLLEDFLKKRLAKSVSSILTPLLSLLIIFPAMIIVIAPLADLVAGGIEKFFTFAFMEEAALAGLMTGAAMPALIMFGMHYLFFPSALSRLDKVGFDNFFLPINLVTNLAQAGACLAVSIRSKDKEMRQMAITGSLSSSLGVSEPAIYGVTMKERKPFYAALIGGATGGAYMAATGVRAFSFTYPGLLSLPVFYQPAGSNFINTLIGIGLAFAISFILSLVFSWERLGLFEK